MKDGLSESLKCSSCRIKNQNGSFLEVIVNVHGYEDLLNFAKGKALRLLRVSPTVQEGDILMLEKTRNYTLAAYPDERHDSLKFLLVNAVGLVIEELVYLFKSTRTVFSFG